MNISGTAAECGQENDSNEVNGGLLRMNEEWAAYLFDYGPIVALALLGFDDQTTAQIDRLLISQTAIQTALAATVGSREVIRLILGCCTCYVARIP